MRGWLKIDSVTGEIFSAAPLDRETESVYRVQVVATEVGEQNKAQPDHRLSGVGGLQ
jgi:hypothetical protein